MPYANCEKAGEAASWVGKEGWRAPCPGRVRTCTSDAEKSQNSFQASQNLPCLCIAPFGTVAPRRILACPSFFFLHIYTQRCCVMLVLLGEWRFFSHHPAYRCFSRVPVCVCVCGKVRLLMIVDTRDTVPYHSSCTMGCSWSRPTMKTSIRSETGMRPLEPVWKVTFGLVASVHFCRLIVIMWARVAICSQRKTGLALGWRLNM